MIRLPKIVKRQDFIKALARTTGVEVSATTAQRDGRSTSLPTGRGDIDRPNMLRVLRALDLETINF